MIASRRGDGRFGVTAGHDLAPEAGERLPFVHAGQAPHGGWLTTTRCFRPVTAAPDRAPVTASGHGGLHQPRIEKAVAPLLTRQTLAGAVHGMAETIR